MTAKPFKILTDKMSPDSKARADAKAIALLQEQHPNFRGENGKLYLVRCFACGGERGTENYAPMVADGQCAWCGWEEEKKVKP